MKRFLIILSVSLFLLIVVAGVALFAATETTSSGTGTTTESTVSTATTMPQVAKYIGAAIAIAGATIGAGIAVGRVGSAAMGAISEKPELTGISLVFIAIAEAISLWGLIVALLILAVF